MKETQKKEYKINVKMWNRSYSNKNVLNKLYVYVEPGARFQVILSEAGHRLF